MSWIVHVHGGLALHEGGGFSAEPGVDPVKDTELHIDRLRVRIGLMEEWLAAAPPPVKEEKRQRDDHAAGGSPTR